jgi:hypothetical protein
LGASDTEEDDALGAAALGAEDSDETARDGAVFGIKVEETEPIVEFCDCCLLTADFEGGENIYCILTES